MESTAAANAAKAVNNSSSNNLSGFSCLFHGQNLSHNTDSCTMMQNYAKELADRNNRNRDNNRGNRGRGRGKGGGKGRGGANNNTVGAREENASDDLYLDASCSLAFAHHAKTASNSALCDSGTTHNMFQDLVFARQPLSPAITITFGNGHTLRATECGSVRLNKSVTRHNVLIVPGLINNLVSTSATPSMYTWDIDSSAARLRLRAHPRTVYITAHAKDGLYLLNIPSKAKVESKANLADSDSKAHLDLVYKVHRELGWRALGRSKNWNASPRTRSTTSNAPIAS